MKDDSPDDRRSTGSYHSFGSIVGGTVARTSTQARTVFVLKQYLVLKAEPVSVLIK